MNRILVHISINIRMAVLEALKEEVKASNKKYGSNTTLGASTSQPEGAWLRDGLAQGNLPGMALAHGTDFASLNREQLEEILLPLPDRFPMDSGLEDKGLRDPAGLLHPMFLIPFVIICNSSMLAPHERPAGWEDLLGPQWYGQVCFPARDVPVTLAVTAYLRANYPAPYQNFAARLSFLKSPVEVSRAVGEGQYPLGIANLGFAKMLTGQQVSTIWPAEGAVCSPLVLAFFRPVEPQLLELGEVLFRPELQDMAARQGFIPVKSAALGLADIAGPGRELAWQGGEAYLASLRTGDAQL